MSLQEMPDEIRRGMDAAKRRSDEATSHIAAELDRITREINAVRQAALRETWTKACEAMREACVKCIEEHQVAFGYAPRISKAAQAIPTPPYPEAVS